MSVFTELVACPRPSEINTGLTPCPTNELVRLHGMPRKTLSEVCRIVQSPYWSAQMETRSVGPFPVTGHRLFLAVLEQLHREIERVNPWLYAALGTAGVLCVRHVRGVPGVLSNHGLGMAIDYTLNGVLDVRGDGRVQRGLLEVYKVAKRFKLFWGAEFRTEDAMHFEASRELVRDWGLL